MIVYSTESPGYKVGIPAAIDVRSTQWQRGRGTIPTSQRFKVTAVGVVVGAPEPLHRMAARRSAA